jgi:hypothetical protein
MRHLMGSFVNRGIHGSAARRFNISPLPSGSYRASRSISRLRSRSSIILSEITSFPKDHPFAFNLILATSKTCAADIVVQTMVEKKRFSDIDWRRNGIFASFGFFYLGGFQWWLLINKFRQWFPTMERFGNLSFSKKLKHRAGIRDAMKMVAFDVIIHSPVIYFPTYYTLKESVGGQKWNPADWVKDGLGKYRKNMLQDLTAMVAVTVPSDCLQVVLPLHLRMIVRHFVSFFWTSYISFSRGAIEEEKELVAK